MHMSIVAPRSHSRTAFLRLVVPITAALIAIATMVTPAMAVTGCQEWDGVYPTTGTNLMAHNGTYTTGNYTEQLGIRFKAEGTNPVFQGWEYNTPVDAHPSFYLRDWSNGSLFNGTDQYVEGQLVAAGGGLVRLPNSNYISLTSGHEYIAEVYLPPSYTIYTNAYSPMIYPNALDRMSASSGYTYYYAFNWPPTWHNADPDAGNNWTLSPIVCQS